MSNYITIDGGTTNTRLRLIKDYPVVAESRLSMGAKDCTVGNEIYKNLIKEKIREELLEKMQYLQKELDDLNKAKKELVFD